MTTSWVFVAVSFIAGLVLSWLWMRAGAERLRAQAREQKLRADSAGTAEQQVRAEAVALREEVTGLRERAAAEKEKIQWVENAQKTLRDTFVALASDALKHNSGEITRQTKDNLQGVVQPLQEKLKTLAAQVQAMEEKRATAYGSLGNELKKLSEAQIMLQTTTGKLSEALYSHTQRGRWGEMQLRRVVELAGMKEHVDYDEQTSRDGKRPDMVIHLPAHGEIPIDAKAPLDAYLEAVQTHDPERRKKKLEDHARAVRDRVRELSRKEYWKQFEHAPEFVVMFVPNEACLVAAFEVDAGLLDEAMQNRVLLCAPVNLLALLRAVAYGWQQQKIADNARQIAEEGKILHDRLGTFLEHLGDVGKAVGKSVEAFNRAVGSYERRVLPSVNRFEDLAAMENHVPDPDAIEKFPRALPGEIPQISGEDSGGGKEGVADPPAPGADQSSLASVGEAPPPPPRSQ